MFFIDFLYPHYPFCRLYKGKYSHSLILENHFFLPAAPGLTKIQSVQNQVSPLSVSPFSELCRGPSVLRLNYDLGPAVIVAQL